MRPPAWRRLLVRATNWVGDAVMSLPALQSLRAVVPEARITVLARPWVAGLYRRERWADEVIEYRAGTGWRDAAGRWAVARNLRARRFDACLLLTNSFDSALTAWAAGIPERIGYSRDGRGLLLTRAVARPRPGEIPKHESFYYLELLRRCGLGDALPAAVTIRLDGIEQARRAGIAALAQHGLGGPVVGVSPGAAYGGAKRWLPDRFAEAASIVAAETNAGVAVFGTGAETAVCEEVAAAVRRRGLNGRSLAGATGLSEFIDMAAACRVFLTNDSGSMHIASALAVPTVTVFGATDETATGPTGPLARIVREPVDCAPCLKRECPIDHRCMTRVDARRVAAVALELLG